MAKLLISPVTQSSGKLFSSAERTSMLSRLTLKISRPVRLILSGMAVCARGLLP